MPNPDAIEVLRSMFQENKPDGRAVSAIWMSRRFRKAYRSASISLQGLIEGAVHDFVRRAEADRTNVLRQYDRLAHLKEVVIEIDVSGARRLLACWERSVLHLLDVGDHDIVSQYTSPKYFLDKQQFLEVPKCFWPDTADGELRFFSRDPCKAYAEYGAERIGEWIYFLSPQQVEVVDEIVLTHDETLKQGGGCNPIFIVGGPGTGKTSVLMNLLKEFTDFQVPTGIRVSNHLQRYITACMPELGIQRFLVDERGESKPHVLLVDDPANVDEIKHFLKLDRNRGLGLIIIAFDPCQLSSFEPNSRSSGVSDAEFTEVCRQFHVDVFGLDACYRQKENVGRASKKAMDKIAESTPFLAQQKIMDFRESHQYLTGIANELTFPNPHGYLQVYEFAQVADVDTELRRIKQKPLWSHWPPLLVVDDVNANPQLQPLLEVVQGVNSQRTSIRDVDEIKGLEFQHAFVFLGRNLFRELESGFSGTGQFLYTQRRLMRIPYSRAKDSLVVFVV